VLTNRFCAQSFSSRLELVAIPVSLFSSGATFCLRGDDSLIVTGLMPSPSIASACVGRRGRTRAFVHTGSLSLPSP